MYDKQRNVLLIIFYLLLHFFCKNDALNLFSVEILRNFQFPNRPKTFLMGAHVNVHTYIFIQNERGKRRKDG